jgi:hypothetical protein
MSGAFVTLVPAEYVADVWNDVEPLLARAVNRTSGRFITSDVYRSVSEDGYLLWIAVVDDKVVGAVVTFFMNYPRKKYLNVQFCGGNDLKAWKDLMFNTLQSFAADNGCDGLEAMGRSGWEGVFKDRGYYPLAQCFEFPLQVTVHAEGDA